MPTHDDVVRVVLIGLGATAVMDAWLLILGRLGLPSSNFALIGRWVGHMRHGRFTHASIAKVQPVRGELALGWVTHYAVGIAYAALLVLVLGFEWAKQPTLWAAVAFGILTVAAPLFLMQPAMGSGFAATKTPAPVQNCLRSVANHTVFGAGLYFTAALIERISR